MGIGQYGAVEVVDIHGNPLPPGTLVNVTAPPGGALATLYTDLTGATVGPNPVALDAYSNLTFYANDATQYGIQAIETTGTAPVEKVWIPGSTATGSGTVTSVTAGAGIAVTGTPSLAPVVSARIGTTAGTVAAGNDIRFVLDQFTTTSVAGTYTIPNAFGGYLLILTGNTTITMPPAAAGASFVVGLTQDATGGRTATFTGVRWPGGTAPTLTATAGARDRLSFYCFDGATWEGFPAGLAMA